MAGKYTKLYNDWLQTTDLTLGPKELKFGLTAFEAGYKAAAKLQEATDWYGFHISDSEGKKLGLVTATNDAGDEMKFIVGFEPEGELQSFESLEEIVERSILYGTFGSGNGGFKVSDVKDMTGKEFEDILGKRAAEKAYRTMEERDYYYTVVSEGKSSTLAKIVQMEDELDLD